MRKPKRFAALLLVMIAIAAATLACDVFAELFPEPEKPTKWELALTAEPLTRIANMETMSAPLQATMMARFVNMPPIIPPQALWSGDSSQMANAYASGSGPTTPFSQLFGNLDQAATLESLKNAIPDLKFTSRMTVQQGAWVAQAFDLSGTFTQPLVTATGTLLPTNQPWFTTVHMVIHVNADGKIDQEYSVTDMAAMLHEAGVAGYENVEVGKLGMEMPMPEEVPSDDPASVRVANAIFARVGNGPFAAWLPSGLPRDMPTTYHSPYGDAVGNIPEVEDSLLTNQDAQVIVPVIVQQGNSFGVLYRYNGTLFSPLTSSDGTVVEPAGTRIQFIGIALGDVDAAGNVKAWNMINRLDNPISRVTFAPAPGITTTQEVAPEATALSDDFGDEFVDNGDTTDTEPPPEANDQATQSAPGTTPTPETSGAATTTCTVTAPQKVNLRQGPGTSFAIGGSLSVGQSAEADGQAKDGNGRAWFHIGSMNLWARSDVVSGDCAALPEIAPG